MKAFLKSIDERVWNSVKYGWEKPTTAISEWQTSQKEAVAFNNNVEVAHTALEYPPNCA